MVESFNCFAQKDSSKKDDSQKSFTESNSVSSEKTDDFDRIYDYLDSMEAASIIK